MKLKTAYNIISLATAVAFFFTNHLVLPPGVLHAGETAGPRAVFESVDSVSVPANIGRIEEIFRGRPDKAVILVQDAHAIPQAQRNIRNLIDFLEQSYGLRKVALEGAASRLDLQILRSFPDEKVLKDTFQEYLEKGELVGSVMAAVFNREAGLYEGIEDWGLYEQGYAHFLEALDNGREIDQWLSGQDAALEERKEQNYSTALRRVDQALRRFDRNQAHLLETLEMLGEFQSPPAAGELALMLEESRKNPDALIPVEVELKEIAEKVNKAFRADAGGPQGEKRREFNYRDQQFRTGKISPEEFALFLKEFLAETSLPVKVSQPLIEAAKKQKKMRDIEGTRFFEEFESYAQSVKESLYQSETDKQLDKQSFRLELLARLNRLELTKKNWNQLKNFAESGEFLTENGIRLSEDRLARLIPDRAVRSKFEPHLRFYENAEKRDEVFGKKLLAMLREGSGKGGASPVMFITGGFHTNGLTEYFRQENVSYIVLTPQIENLPQDIRYKDHMRGYVSWRDYFEAEQGRVNIYKAFVRATRDRLINRSGQDTGRLLRKWRDRLMLDLADQGRLGEASKYTFFIDEAARGGAAIARREVLRKKAEEFLEGLRELQITNQLTEQNILRLLQPATIQAGTLVPAASQTMRREALGMGAGAPDPRRSELRGNLFLSSFGMEGPEIASSGSVRESVRNALFRTAEDILMNNTGISSEFAGRHGHDFTKISVNLLWNYIYNNGNFEHSIRQTMGMYPPTAAIDHFSRTVDLFQAGIYTDQLADILAFSLQTQRNPRADRYVEHLAHIHALNHYERVLSPRLQFPAVADGGTAIDLLSGPGFFEFLPSLNPNAHYIAVDLDTTKFVRNWIGANQALQGVRNLEVIPEDIRNFNQPVSTIDLIRAKNVSGYVSDMSPADWLRILSWLKEDGILVVQMDKGFIGQHLAFVRSFGDLAEQYSIEYLFGPEVDDPFDTLIVRKTGTPDAEAWDRYSGFILSSALYPSFRSELRADEDWELEKILESVLDAGLRLDPYSEQIRTQDWSQILAHEIDGREHTRELIEEFSRAFIAFIVQGEKALTLIRENIQENIITSYMDGQKNFSAVIIGNLILGIALENRWNSEIVDKSANLFEEVQDAFPSTDEAVDLRMNEIREQLQGMRFDEHSRSELRAEEQPAGPSAEGMPSEGLEALTDNVFRSAFANTDGNFLRKNRMLDKELGLFYDFEIRTIPEQGAVQIRVIPLTSQANIAALHQEDLFTKVPENNWTRDESGALEYLLPYSPAEGVAGGSFYLNLSDQEIASQLRATTIFGQTEALRPNGLWPEVLATIAEYSQAAKNLKMESKVENRETLLAFNRALNTLPEGVLQGNTQQNVRRYQQITNPALLSADDVKQLKQNIHDAVAEVQAAAGVMIEIFPSRLIGETPLGYLHSFFGTEHYVEAQVEEGEPTVRLVTERQPRKRLDVRRFVHDFRNILSPVNMSQQLIRMLINPDQAEQLILMSKIDVRIIAEELGELMARMDIPGIIAYMETLNAYFSEDYIDKLKKEAAGLNISSDARTYVNMLVENLGKISAESGRFARGESEPFRVVLVNPLLSRLVPAFAGNIHVTLKISETERAFIFTRLGFLERIVGNVIKNAKEAIDESSIKFGDYDNQAQQGAVTPREPRIDVETKIEGESILLEVANRETVAFTEDQIALINAGRSLPTTKESGTGTGLGSVYELVRGLGGEIGYTANLDPANPKENFVKVTIRLPINSPAALVRSELRVGEQGASVVENNVVITARIEDENYWFYIHGRDEAPGSGNRIASAKDEAFAQRMFNEARRLAQLDYEPADIRTVLRLFASAYGSTHVQAAKNDFDQMPWFYLFQNSPELLSVGPGSGRLNMRLTPQQAVLVKAFLNRDPSLLQIPEGQERFFGALFPKELQALVFHAYMRSLLERTENLSDLDAQMIEEYRARIGDTGLELFKYLLQRIYRRDHDTIRRFLGIVTQGNLLTFEGDAKEMYFGRRLERNERAASFFEFPLQNYPGSRIPVFLAQSQRLIFIDFSYNREANRVRWKVTDEAGRDILPRQEAGEAAIPEAGGRIHINVSLQSSFGENVPALKLYASGGQADGYIGIPLRLLTGEERTALDRRLVVEVSPQARFNAEGGFQPGGEAIPEGAIDSLLIQEALGRLGGEDLLEPQPERPEPPVSEVPIALPADPYEANRYLFSHWRDMFRFHGRPHRGTPPATRDQERVGFFEVWLDPVVGRIHTSAQSALEATAAPLTVRVLVYATGRLEAQLPQGIAALPEVFTRSLDHFNRQREAERLWLGEEPVSPPQAEEDRGQAEEEPAGIFPIAQLPSPQAVPSSVEAIVQSNRLFLNQNPQAFPEDFDPYAVNYNLLSPVPQAEGRWTIYLNRQGRILGYAETTEQRHFTVELESYTDGRLTVYQFEPRLAPLPPAFLRALELHNQGIQEGRSELRSPNISDVASRVVKLWAGELPEGLQNLPKGILQVVTLEGIEAMQEAIRGQLSQIEEREADGLEKTFALHKLIVLDFIKNLFAEFQEKGLAKDGLPVGLALPAFYEEAAAVAGDLAELGVTEPIIEGRGLDAAPFRQRFAHYRPVSGFTGRIRGVAGGFAVGVFNQETDITRFFEDYTSIAAQGEKGESLNELFRTEPERDLLQQALLRDHVRFLVSASAVAVTLLKRARPGISPQAMAELLKELGIEVESRIVSGGSNHFAFKIADSFKLEKDIRDAIARAA